LLLPNGPAQDIAARAVEDSVEREGFVLSHWNPHRARPRLRIIGTPSNMPSTLQQVA